MYEALSYEAGGSITFVALVNLPIQDPAQDVTVMFGSILATQVCNIRQHTSAYVSIRQHALRRMLQDVTVMFGSILATQV